jgi:hypothetical protein
MRPTLDARSCDADAPDSRGELRAFLASVLRNEFVAEILERTRGIDLPEWYLSGGCLFQTVWNIDHGFEPSTGILDYDLFYFDDADLSQRAERTIGGDIARTFAHLPVKIEVSNQARVHLWYEDEFGAPCRAFECCEDGIDAFLAICCCFGVRDTGETLQVYAPHGFDDLFGLVVRPNPARTIESSVLSNVYRSKVERWSQVWPRLTIVQWPMGSGESQ